MHREMTTAQRALTRVVLDQTRDHSTPGRLDRCVSRRQAQRMHGCFRSSGADNGCAGRRARERRKRPTSACLLMKFFRILEEVSFQK